MQPLTSAETLHGDWTPPNKGYQPLKNLFLLLLVSVMPGLPMPTGSQSSSPHCAMPPPCHQLPCLPSPAVSLILQTSNSSRVGLSPRSLVCMVSQLLSQSFVHHRPPWAQHFLTPLISFSHQLPSPRNTYHSFPPTYIESVKATFLCYHCSESVNNFTHWRNCFFLFKHEDLLFFYSFSKPNLLSVPRAFEISFFTPAVYLRPGGNKGAWGMFPMRFC